MKQECVLSLRLFILAVDLFTKETSSDAEGYSGLLIQYWRIFFVDDICLLSSRHKNTQNKTNKLASKIRLIVNAGKIKLMKQNVSSSKVLGVDNKNSG